MSSSTIVNAAPMAITLGIQDNSVPVKSVQPSQVPTHCPKVYLFTETGPTEEQLVSGDGAVALYGANTFDARKKFATHQTVLSTAIFGAGNAQMIKRVLPDDVGPKANVALSLDVLPVDIPVYQRGPDGAYVTNPTTGQPIPVTPAATVPGFRVKWVVSRITAGGGSGVSDATVFGNLTIGPGDQTEGAVTSTRYPIFQFWDPYFGEYSNNFGYRLFAPTTNSETPINKNFVNAMKAYVFRIQGIQRNGPESTAQPRAALNGDQFINFVLRPGTVNPLTDGNAYFGDLFTAGFRRVGVPNFQDFRAPVSNFRVYQANLDLLLAQFYAAEKDIVGAGLDFTPGATDEMYLFNLISGRSTTGAPYHSFVVNGADANSVILNESTNIFAGGASDGTIDLDTFADLVSTEVKKYVDPNSSLLETAINVESIIYDTGFPIQTKRDMISFIAIRKDTFVVLSTYTVDGGPLTASDEAAVAASLKARLQLFPESSFFGTPVVRGMVVARYGTYLDSLYPKQLPLTIEIGLKAARMMGAGNATWKREFLFDSAPLSQVDFFSNTNSQYVPSIQRNIDWANGLNYPIAFSREKLFFPALKTAYVEDASVLTNFFTAMACVQLEKVGIQVWREFSGAIRYTPEQLVDKVNQSVIDKTTGRFAGLFKIIPAAFISDGDRERGFSYTLPIQIYANVANTVMTLSVQAYRMSQLPA